MGFERMGSPVWQTASRGLQPSPVTEKPLMDAATAAPPLGTGLPPARILWVGPVRQPDMRMARRFAAQLAEVYEVESPAAAIAGVPEPFVDRSPAVVLLATDAPGRWSLDDLLRLAIRWPLAPIVAVASGLVDGRRRTGPVLPGIEEVPWHDLPGRLAWWLVDRLAGRAGSLGVPATVRREDRFLEASRVARGAGRPVFPSVSLAAASSVDLEGLVDLAQAAGAPIGRRTRGRPPLDEPAAALVWDIGRLDAEKLAWLRMLSANRPALQIILLESFPRPDTTAAAIQAGAAAVLGRPASAEALAGTLVWLTAPTGLSSPAAGG
jgi:hypothetical protein